MSSIKVRRVSAIILAGGSGTRMMADITKQRMLVGGMSILKRSVIAFDECPDIDEIVVIVREDELDFAKEELSGIPKVVNIGIGGSTRAASAECGFKLISDDTELVAIHDAARPMITSEMISEVVVAARKTGAATAAAPVTDTIKIINNVGNVQETLDRSTLVRATTPQIFDRKIYQRALDTVNDKSDITDDNMLVERIGVSVYAVIQERENPKVTSRSDIAYLEMLLSMEDKNG